MEAIVYRSNTGHTLEYAKVLSEELDIPYYSVKEAKKILKPNSEIIFLGWVCATKIQGLNKVKNYSVACVGAVGAYPYELEYIESLKKSNHLKQVFYMRGGINYQKLKGFKKKILELVGKAMAKDHPEDQEMIKLFQNGANYVKKDNLKEIITYIRNVR